MRDELGDFAVFKGGSAFPQHEQGSTAGAVPFMKVSDLARGTGTWRVSDAAHWISEEQVKRLRPVIAPPGATVFAKIGEGLRAERCRLIEIPTAIDNNMMAAIPTERSNSAFLYYLLKTVGLADHAVGSALPYLKQSTLTKIAVDLPGRPGQDAIAEVLSALDDKIAANSALAASITALLAAHFNSLGLFDEPDDEELIAVGELFDLNPTTVTPTEVEPVYVDMQKIPTAGPSIRDWDHRPAKGGARFVNGDTLLARITPCLENRKTGYVDFLHDGQVGIGSTEFIVIRSREGFPGPLSYFLATSEPFRTFAIRHMSGTSGRQRVSALDLSGFTINRPDDDKLAAFGARSEAGFVKLKSLTDESRTLAATRDTLLPQLMSGKLQVKDAEEAIESLV